MDTYKDYLKNTNAYPTDMNGWPCYIGFKTDHEFNTGYMLRKSDRKEATYYTYNGRYEITVTIKDDKLIVKIPYVGSTDKNIVILSEPEFNETQGYHVPYTKTIKLRNLFNSMSSLEENGKTSFLTLGIPDMTGLDTIVSIYTDDSEQLMARYANSQDRPVNIETARYLCERISENTIINDKNLKAMSCEELITNLQQMPKDAKIKFNYKSVLETITDVKYLKKDNVVSLESNL